MEKVETDRVFLVRQEMAHREGDYLDLIRELREEHERYRAETVREIEVHEAIGRKQASYQEVLKKELIIA